MKKIIILLLMSGCVQGPKDSVYRKIPPSKVENGQITLTQKAADRLGIEMARALPYKSKLLIPVESVLYETDGSAWVYLLVAPLTYQRARVDVSFVQENDAVVSGNIDLDSKIVTLGSAELFGTEYGVGK